MEPIEKYFSTNNIKVLKVLNTGTSMKFTTEEGIFVKTYEGRFFKLLPKNGIEEIKIKKSNSAATESDK